MLMSVGRIALPRDRRRPRNTPGSRQRRSRGSAILPGRGSRLRPCSPLLRRAGRGALVPRPRNDGGRSSRGAHFERNKIKANSSYLLKIQLPRNSISFDSLSQGCTSHAQKLRRFNLISFRSLHREQREFSFQPWKQLKGTIR